MCRRHKKGTQETEALGRSRGGFSTKLHARCDAKGRPLGFVLTPGQSHDIQGFGPLFRLIVHKIEALLADKGYDADAIREELANADVEAVIPAKSNRRDPIPHDREKYRWRNLVERLFNKLKNWRRIATRYDKTKESYLGFVNLVSALQWIPFVHETYDSAAAGFLTIFFFPPLVAFILCFGFFREMQREEKERPSVAT